MIQCGENLWMTANVHRDIWVTNNCFCSELGPSIKVFFQVFFFFSRKSSNFKRQEIFSPSEIQVLLSIDLLAPSWAILCKEIHLVSSSLTILQNNTLIIMTHEFLTCIKFSISYCEWGAIPLAFPKNCPATTTGIPWFPAATEAVCLYITDTSEWTFSEKTSKMKF